MRSCMMALELASSALGSYTAGILVIVVNVTTGWITPDLNKGRLDLFFLFLAGLMLANTFLFVLVAGRFKYKDVAHVMGEFDDTVTPAEQEKGIVEGELPFSAAAHAAAQHAHALAVAMPAAEGRRKAPAHAPVPAPRQQQPAREVPGVSPIRTVGAQQQPAAAPGAGAAAAAAAPVPMAGKPPASASASQGLPPRPVPAGRAGPGPSRMSGLAAALAAAPQQPAGEEGDILSAVSEAGPSVVENTEAGTPLGASFADYMARSKSKTKKSKGRPGRAVAEEDLFGRSLAYRGASPKFLPKML